MKTIVSLLLVLFALQAQAVTFRCAGADDACRPTITIDTDKGEVDFDYLGVFAIDKAYNSAELFVIEFEGGKSTFVIHQDDNPETGFGAFYFYGKVDDLYSYNGDPYNCKIVK